MFDWTQYANDFVLDFYNTTDFSNDAVSKFITDNVPMTKDVLQLINGHDQSPHFVDDHDLDYQFPSIPFCTFFREPLGRDNPVGISQNNCLKYIIYGKYFMQFLN